MIAVADAGPIHYLCLLRQAHVLSELFGRVVLPSAVADAELAAAETPLVVREVIKDRPDWLDVAEPSDNATVRVAATLGLGERQAIALAVELGADWLLCDDLAARREAEHADLRVIGTLGILRRAALNGLLDFHSALDELITQTNFRHSPQLIARVRDDFDRETR
ncbi:MAG: DUF3368 domain-containing protein [Planctomycetota bacterium]